MKFYDAWGSDQTYPHMSVAWSWAFDTPFKWTKQVASHFGGTRQGMAMSWPARIKDVGGIRSQFHHVIDIVPTILEAAGIPAPVMVNGVAQKPIEGVSMAYTWDKANADAPSTRHNAVFRDVRQPRHLPRRLVCLHDAASAALADGHGAMPEVVNGYKWELYNLAEDFSQANDLAARQSRQVARNAGIVSGGGREVRRVPARQLDPGTPYDAAAERDRRAERVHLFGRHVRHADRRRAEHRQ